jgi:hypothetical protein
VTGCASQAPSSAEAEGAAHCLATARALAQACPGSAGTGPVLTQAPGAPPRGGLAWARVLAPHPGGPRHDPADSAPGLPRLPQGRARQSGGAAGEFRHGRLAVTD